MNILSRISKNLFFFKLSLFVILIIVITTFLGRSIDTAFGEPKSIVRIGMAGEIDPMSPNDTVAMNTEGVIPHMFEQLVIADMSMNIHPQLATSWEVTSDGNLIFKLRKGVKFHDGTTFDADAVKFSFDRIVNEKLKRWPMIRPFFKSLEILDKYTVKMNIKGPPDSALAVLAIRGHIESPAAVKKYGKDFGLHPVGTGHFKFVEWIPDQRVVLEANKDHWAGEPKISQVIFRPIPDTQSRLAMLEAGDLDVCTRPPLTELPRIKGHPGLKIVDRPSATIFYVQFNTVKSPFDNKKVRQAISYSIDRKGIVNSLLFGVAPVADTYAGSMVKHVVKYDIYPYNPEKAKSILGELGWKTGKSSFLEKGGEVFKTAIVTPSGRYPMDRQIAEAIQAQLKKIGIDAKVTVLESAAFLKALLGDQKAKESAEFGMMIVIRPMGPDPDGALMQHFHSNAFPPKGSNNSIYKNNEVDRLLDEASNITDENKRGPIFKRIQDLLNEDVPWLPIYVVPDYSAVKKELRGVGYRHPITPITVQPDARWER